MLFCLQKSNASTLHSMMSDFPLERLVTAIGHSVTGLDHFSPFFVTFRRSSEKRWAILFTRAVHIEIVPSMDTGSCVMGIERFIVIARRSTASVVWSDYGTIFVRAEKVLLLCLEN